MTPDDFESDMRRWHQIAVEAHSRHAQGGNLYVRMQSPVEAAAHRRVAELRRNARRILEIGIGGGEHLAFTGGITDVDLYVGLDIDRDYARLSHQQLRLPVLVADASRLPFASSAFDTVLALNVLEHVDGLESTVAELGRVLMPGGRLLVVIPTNGSLVISMFRAIVTYPFMRSRGIENPSLVWHYLNVNGYLRVQSILAKRMIIEHTSGAPVRWLPWWLSPMYVFECRNP